MTTLNLGDIVWIACRVVEAPMTPASLRLAPLAPDGTKVGAILLSPDKYYHWLPKATPRVRLQAEDYERRVPPAEAYQDLLDEVARLKAEVKRLRGHVALPHQRSTSSPKGWFFEPPHPDDDFWGEWFHEDCPAVAGPGQGDLLGCAVVNNKLVLCRDCGQKVELEVDNPTS